MSTTEPLSIKVAVREVQAGYGRSYGEPEDYADEEDYERAVEYYDQIGRYEEYFAATLQCGSNYKTLESPRWLQDGERQRDPKNPMIREAAYQILLDHISFQLRKLSLNPES